jgi:hypothetical protein
VCVVHETIDSGGRDGLRRDRMSAAAKTWLYALNTQDSRSVLL